MTNDPKLPPLPYIDPYFPTAITANLLQSYARFAVEQASQQHADELVAYQLTVENLRTQNAPTVDLAQPQGEPVAWGMPDAEGNIVDTITTLEKDGTMKKWENQYTVPLYTHLAHTETEQAKIERLSKANILLESALVEACPRGARGAVFEYWNEARKLLSD